MKHPKSEKTLKKHNYLYQGIKYVNDMGHPCEYRLTKNGKDLRKMVKYYRGILLAEYQLKKIDGIGDYMFRVV